MQGRPLRTVPSYGFDLQGSVMECVSKLGQKDNKHQNTFYWIIHRKECVQLQPVFVPVVSGCVEFVGWWLCVWDNSVACGLQPLWQECKCGLDIFNWKRAERKRGRLSRLQIAWIPASWTEECERGTSVAMTAGVTRPTSTLHTHSPTEEETNNKKQSSVLMVKIWFNMYSARYNTLWAVYGMFILKPRLQLNYEMQTYAQQMKCPTIRSLSVLASFRMYTMLSLRLTCYTARQASKIMLFKGNSNYVTHLNSLKWLLVTSNTALFFSGAQVFFLPHHL